MVLQASVYPLGGKGIIDVQEYLTTGVYRVIRIVIGPALVGPLILVRYRTYVNGAPIGVVGTTGFSPNH